MSRYRDMARWLREDWRYEPIRILVFGPKEPDPGSSQEECKGYEKRLQIRQELATQFPRAQVYFPEDPEMAELAPRILGQLQRQAVQASISHGVVMLTISRGVDLELDYFVPTYPWFREKAFVLLPERYLPPQGLVAEVLELLPHEHILGFSEQEFDECEVATVKAVQIADTIAAHSCLTKPG